MLLFNYLELRCIFKVVETAQLIDVNKVSLAYLLSFQIKDMHLKRYRSTVKASLSNRSPVPGPLLSVPSKLASLFQVA